MTENLPQRSSGDVFVGRDRELGELKTALEEAMAGRGRLVMLAGEPGIGKTRLAQELASVAEARGTRALWGRCVEERGAPPYWPWVQALRAHTRTEDLDTLLNDMGAGASDIAEVLPELKERLPDLQRSSIDDAESARFRLFDSIGTLLKTASQRQPILVVLDNLHWADTSSLRLLEFIAPDLPRSRMLVIGTYRDVGVSRGHALFRTLGDLTSQGLLHRVAMRGLSEVEVGHLTEALAGWRPPEELMARVHQQTAGSPLFVSEMVKLLVQEGLIAPDRVEDLEAAQFRLPDGIREVIGRRLDGLSEECNEILAAAAIIGREFSLDVLGAGSDKAPEALLDVVDEGLRAGVLQETSRRGRYEFSHGLVQQTLVSELSLTRQVTLHARIAQALEEVYGTYPEPQAEQLAYHYGEAATLLGTDKLVRYSLLAGEQALRAYAYEEALGHFQRALAAKEGQSRDDEMADILFAVGRSLYLLNRRFEAQSRLLRAFGYYAGAGNKAQAVAIACLPLDLYYLPETRELISRALDLVEPGSQDAGHLLSRYGMTLSFQRDFSGARDAFSEALKIGERATDPNLGVWTLGRWGVTELVAGNIDEAVQKLQAALDQADESVDQNAVIHARYWLAHAVMTLGDTAGAAEHAGAALQAAKRFRSRFRLQQAYGANLTVACSQGRWRDAREFYRGIRDSTPDPTSFDIGRESVYEYEIGDYETAGRALRDALDMDRDSDAAERRIGGLGGGLRLWVDAGVWDESRGQLAVFLADVGYMINSHELMDWAERTLNCWPGHFPGIFELAAQAFLAAAKEDKQKASDLYPMLLQHRGQSAMYRHSADRIMGLLTRTIGQLHSAADHFEEALSFCRKGGFRPELAWTCHDYADLLLQRNGPGDNAKAMSLIEEGLSIAQELSMSPMTERLKALQARAEAIPARAPAYPDGLTRREVEVLRLIAAGRSNQDIADELVISLNTVFRHVSNIFSKTGASNRTEAATYAHQHNLVESGNRSDP